MIQERTDLEKLTKRELLDLIEEQAAELAKYSKVPSDVELIRLRAELDGAHKEIVRLKTKHEGRIGLGAHRNPKA